MIDERLEGQRQLLWLVVEVLREHEEIVEESSFKDLAVNRKSVDGEDQGDQRLVLRFLQVAVSLVDG